MEYMRLNNGVEIPLLGLGTWDLNGKECIEVVSQAIQLGYRLIDTAQMYGNEEEVGQGIIDSGISRDELFITTKIYRNSNSYKKAKQAIETSLKNLNLDYIDLMLIHEPYYQGPQMYKALEEAYREGKIRAIGISNYNEKWLNDFLDQCTIIPAINQVENHIYYQKWNFQDILQSYDIKMQAWSPLAQGNSQIMNETILKEISRKYNKSVPQIILRFITQRGISVIPKTKSKERLIENMNIFDFELTADEIEIIKKLDKDKTLYSWTESF